MELSGHFFEKYKVDQKNLFYNSCSVYERKKDVNLLLFHDILEKLTTKQKFLYFSSIKHIPLWCFLRKAKKGAI